MCVPLTIIWIRFWPKNNLKKSNGESLFKLPVIPQLLLWNWNICGLRYAFCDDLALQLELQDERGLLSSDDSTPLSESLSIFICFIPVRNFESDSFSDSGLLKISFISRLLVVLDAAILINKPPGAGKERVIKTTRVRVYIWMNDRKSEDALEEIRTYANDRNCKCVHKHLYLWR